MRERERTKGRAGEKEISRYARQCKEMLGEREGLTEGGREIYEV